MTDRVLVAGEALFDMFPADAESLAAATTFERRAGGAPANVAVALANLGHDPLFWTRVGSGPFGDALVDALRNHGVPQRFVERDPSAPTTLAFVGQSDGDRQFRFYRTGTADTRLRPGTVPDEVLDDVAWLSIGGVALSSDPAREAVFDLVRRGRDAGCRVVFDPNARPELWRDYDFGDTVRELLPAVDVLKATPEELERAGLGEGEGVQAERVFEAGPHTLLATKGSEGAVAYASDAAPWGPATVERESRDVDAVDPTGAGDAFTAGTLAALLDGSDELADILDRATAVAALATTETGAMAALPTRDELEAFLAE